MLDDLLGRGFSSKVKSLIKATKTRIEAVRKKRNATHKFLKKDIADLLANGLDINAFGRAEGLVSELIISSCYDFVDHCCDCVLKNLSAMQKKRECSEDCKVAVASLMFAAARFSDLPELRDLRQIFQGRYGNSLELYMNQKFVKNLSAKPASTENKLQLMQDIAVKYSIAWSSMDFEQRMSKSLSPTPKEHVDNGSSHKMEPGNCKNKVNYTTLRGLFDKPNPDSKENANARNQIQNIKSFNEDLSSNANKAFSFKEDFGTRRVEPILPLFTGKNGTESLHANSKKQFIAGEEAICMPEPNSSMFSFRRDIKVSDTRDSHKHGGVDVTYKLKSHNGKEHFPMGSKNIEVRNLQEVVASDPVQSDSFSLEKKLNFVTGGHESLEITEKAEPQKLFRQELEIHLSGEQLPSKIKSGSVESLISSNIKHQNRSNTGQIQAEDAMKYNHFRPPPYVKPSKTMLDAVNSESSYVNIHGKYVTPRVHAVERIRPRSGSSHEGHVKLPKASRHAVKSESKHAGLCQKDAGRHLDVVDQIRSKSGQLSGRAWSQYDHHESENQINESGRTTHHDQGEACSDHGDISRFILPKPRSIRRRSTKSSSNDSSHNEGSGKSDQKRSVARPSTRRRRRELRRTKHHTLLDSDIPIKDEEDKILDNLLIHYSSKASNRDIRGDASKKSDELPVTKLFPPRSVSLPREHSSPLQPTKVFTRAATFQLDRAAKHVHPKLPDYDDLEAKFLAMKVKYYEREAYS